MKRKPTKNEKTGAGATASPPPNARTASVLQAELGLVYLTANQVAQMLQIHRRTVTRMVRSKELPCYKMRPTKRGGLRFLPSDIQAAMEKRKLPVAA
jgi:excisionase family DNA binding protein